MSSQNTMGKKRCYGEWECESLSFDIMLIPNSADSQGGCEEEEEEEEAAVVVVVPTTSPNNVERYS